MRSASVALLGLLACAPQPPPDDAADGLWSATVRRSSWWPRLLQGFVVLRTDDDGVAGTAWFDAIHANRAFLDVRDASSSGDRLRLSLDPIAEGTSFELDLARSGDMLEGTMSWTHDGRAITDALVAVKRDVRRFDEHATGERLPVEPDPAAAGVDPDLVDALVLLGERSNSDALIVVSDGRLVCERYYGRAPTPMSLQSITKPIASLALSFLVDEGRIPDLDVPLSRWYPEFGSDARRDVTLRHVLTHTTGLDPGDTQELNRSSDKLAHARAAPLVDPPGTRYVYNNRAMQLLSGIVEAETGTSVAAYVGRRVFEPLGIRVGDGWSSDDEGRTSTYGGLNLAAIDLAVLGWMLADEGRWAGQPIVPERWIHEMAEPASDVDPQVGLAWRLIQPPDATEPIGFGHSGSQGQLLYVFPDADLVVVRLVTLKQDEHEEREQAFAGLLPVAERLAADKAARRAP